MLTKSDEIDTTTSVRSGTHTPAECYRETLLEHPGSAAFNSRIVFSSDLDCHESKKRIRQQLKGLFNPFSVLSIYTPVHKLCKEEGGKQLQIEIEIGKPL